MTLYLNDEDTLYDMLSVTDEDTLHDMISEACLTIAFRIHVARLV